MEKEDKISNNIVEGMLEIAKGNGFLRSAKHKFAVRPADPVIRRDMLGSYNLREGLFVKARVGPGKKKRYVQVSEIVSLNGHSLDDYVELTRFDDFVVIDPNEMIHLETSTESLADCSKSMQVAGNLSMRVMDLLTPIGKGQRGLIVSPPRTGKTILLQQIAHGVTTNHPEIHLMVLLIDERPEEVTEMSRNIKGEIMASSNDKTVESHVRTARLALEMAKRRVEFGQDVVILLDSITRLGRAFNAWTSSSGRTMSGGLDIRALQLPKQIFGSARNNENGGSLTIMATALIDTGSRMDEVIFQEFKGTGNMELVLDRQLANRRIWPAIDISQSGTRKEELLIDRATLDKIGRLRRHLDTMQAGQDTEMLIRAMKKHPTNEKFLAELP